MNYLYDSTFEGFLTCIYEHYYTQRADGIFPEGAYQLDMTIRALSVLTDEAKAHRVADAIVHKISKYDMERIFRVFHTNDEDKEMKLLRYVSLGFKRGSSLRLLHSDPVVLEVQKAEHQIGVEVHRLCGLIRFSSVTVFRQDGLAKIEPDGTGTTGLSLPENSKAEILYAAIDPDHDVLPFLAEHFRDRYKSSPFIIHDTKRKKALFAYDRQWYIADFEDEDLLVNTEKEENYQNLWKLYHNIMATKERLNPRCQKNFMPVRYWKNLIEFK
jgi:probable DNA metabolism protein